MVLSLGGKNLFGNSIFHPSGEDGQGLVFAGDRYVYEEPTTKTETKWEDEFTTTSLDISKWTETTQIDGTSSQTGGIITQTTGAESTGYDDLLGKKSFTPNINGNLTIEVRARPNITAGNVADWKIGIQSSTGGAPTDQAIFRHIISSDALSQCSTIVGKDSTTISTLNLTCLDNTWHTFKIVLGTTFCEHYLDNILVSLKNENIPNDGIMYPYLSIMTNTGSAQTLEVDYFRVYYG